MIHLFTIPRIIPKRRISGVGIALIISSAIFMTSSSILLDMTYVNQDFFGADDDIIVYYNTIAITPFTSAIPRVLVNSFEEIRGVITVSPETLFPGMIKDEPIYIRGVDYSKIFELEGIEIVEGNIPSENDHYEGLIGKDLAGRLNINLNDTFTVQSVLNDEIIEFQIRGIIKSEGISNDELLINLELANELHQMPPFSITHLRVRYDPKIIHKDEILELALRTYNIDIVLDFGNYSKNIYYYTKLVVSDPHGNVAFENGGQNNYSFKLVTGYYNFELFNNNELINSTSRYIQNDVDIQFLNIKNNFEINFRIVSNNQTISNMEYRIYEVETNELIRSGISDINGSFNAILDEGNYTLKLNEKDWGYTYPFLITKKKEFLVELNLDDLIALDTGINGTIISYTRFQIKIPNLSTTNNLFIDNIFYPMSNYNPLTKLLSLELEQGTHNITIYRYDLIVLYIFFEIDESLEYFSSKELYSSAKYKPNQKVGINTNGIYQLQSISLLNGSNLVYQQNSNNITLSLPGTIGFYEIIATGLDALNIQYSRNWRIIVDTTSSFVGWSEVSPLPVVMPGDVLTLWTNIDAQLTVDIGDLNKIEDQWLFNVPDNKTGNFYHNTTYDIKITNGLGEFEILSFRMISDYQSLYNFKNSSGYYEIDDIVGSEVELKFVDNNKFNNPYFWQFELNFGNGYFILHPNSTFSLPNSEQSVQVRIRSPFSNNSVDLNITLFDSSAVEDYPLLQNGYPSGLINGQIKLLDVHNNSVRIDLFKSGVPFSPILLDNETIQLSPGIYSSEVYYSGSGMKYDWQFVINPWINSNHIIGNNYYADLGFINNVSRIHICPGIISVDNEIHYITNSITKPSYNYILNKETNSFEITLLNAAEGNYTLSYSNGTVIESKYTIPIIIDDTINIDLIIEFQSLSMIDEKYTSQLELELGIPYTHSEIEVFNRSRDIISDMRLIIEYHHTMEKIEYSLNQNNASFIIFAQPQEVSMRFYIDSLLIESVNFYLNEKNEVYVGSPIVSFGIFNYNYHIYENQSEIVLTNLLTNQSLILQSFTNITLAPGSYLAEYSIRSYHGNSTIEVEFSKYYKLNLTLPLGDLKLRFINYSFDSSSIIYLKHMYIEYSITSLVGIYSEEILLKNMPIGWWNISIQGLWGSWNTSIHFTSDVIHEIRIMAVDSVQMINVIDFGKVMDIIEFGEIQGSDYLNTYLDGALILITIIIFTQIIVIGLVLLFNMQEIASNLSYESRRELQLMKSIGGSQNQIIFSYSKYLFAGSIFISLIGYLISKVLIYWLILSNNTVFFGHKFIPSVDSIGLILTNMFVTFAITYISIVVSYNREVNNSN